jgi:hypothetical protein
MPKGEIVGKCLPSSVCLSLMASSGGTALKKMRAAKAKLKIREFTEEKEDRDPQPLDLIQKTRPPSDQTEAVRGLPSVKAKVKSRHNQDRLFGRTRGSDRAPPGEAR